MATDFIAAHNMLLASKMRELVNRKMGMVITDDNLDHFMAYVMKMVKENKLETVAEYHNLLTAKDTDDPDWQKLLELILIKETTFFRNPMQFQSFKNKILPEILDKRHNATLRIWVAGTSTGEEAYTLAIVMNEARAEMMRDINYRILATDISFKSLEIAQKGFYAGRTVKTINENILKKYFYPHKDGYIVRDEIKDTIDFRYQNFASNTWPPFLIGKWDIIFCRNVIIYFKNKLIERLMDRFHELLIDNGYFFAGHSENIGVISEKFLPVEMNGVFVYKKEPFKFVQQSPKEIKISKNIRDKAIQTMRSEHEHAHVKRSHDAPARSDFHGDLADDRSKRKKERRELGLSHCGKARELFKTDDCAKALLYLDSVIQLDPDIAEAYLLKAQIQTNHGELEEAAKNCNKVLELDKLSAPAHFILGMIELKNGNTEKAETAFKRTVYIDKDFALAYFQLANLFQAKGDTENALRQIDNTLKILESGDLNEWVDYSAGLSQDFLLKACEKSKLNLQNITNSHSDK